MSQNGQSAGADTVNVDGYYVIRGYTEGHDFSSTLDLPKEDAIKVMEERHPFRGKGPADENGNRDQRVYYEDRKATDEWLREQGGIKGDRENPVFFTLTKDPENLLKLMAGHGSSYSHFMVVPVASLDANKWTFTVDDSMGNFFSRHGDDVNENTANFLHDSNPEHGKVKNLRQIVEAMEKYPNTPNGMPREFEAQFWGPKFDAEELGGKIVETPAIRAQVLREEKTAAAGGSKFMGTKPAALDAGQANPPAKAPPKNASQIKPGAG
ncbi:MAG: hypothetical protein GC185_02190 [Alphaproteobacteria bacterium]|nr:hypothetical protein [Alphaproteobacteria bacterium]